MTDTVIMANIFQRFTSEALLVYKSRMEHRSDLEVDVSGWRGWVHWSWNNKVSASAAVLDKVAKTSNRVKL